MVELLLERQHVAAHALDEAGKPLFAVVGRKLTPQTTFAGASSAEKRRLVARPSGDYYVGKKPETSRTRQQLANLASSRSRLGGLEGAVLWGLAGSLLSRTGCHQRFGSAGVEASRETATLRTYLLVVKNRGGIVWAEVLPLARMRLTELPGGKS